MAGMFDDLIPQQTVVKPKGMFDDLIPSKPKGPRYYSADDPPPVELKGRKTPKPEPGMPGAKTFTATGTTEMDNKTRQKELDAMGGPTPPNMFSDLIPKKPVTADNSSLMGDLEASWWQLRQALAGNKLASEQTKTGLADLLEKKAIEQGLPLHPGITDMRTRAQQGQEQAVQDIAKFGGKAGAIPEAPVATAFNNSKTFGEAWSNFWVDPLTVTRSTVARSAAISLPSVVGGIVGSVFGPAGAAAGAGAGSYTAEMGSAIAEQLQKHGADMNNPQSIQKVWAVHKDAITKAAHERALVVGGVDALTGGVVSKIAAAPGAGIIKKEIAGTLTEGAGGALGEAGAQYNEDGTLAWGPIAGEFVGQLGTGAVQTGGQIAVEGMRGDRQPVATSVPPPQATPQTVNTAGKGNRVEPNMFSDLIPKPAAPTEATGIAPEDVQSMTPGQRAVIEKDLAEQGAPPVSEPIAQTNGVQPIVDVARETKPEPGKAPLAPRNFAPPKENMFADLVPQQKAEDAPIEPRQMSELRAFGYSDTQIQNMTPLQRKDSLWASKTMVQQEKFTRQAQSDPNWWAERKNWDAELGREVDSGNVLIPENAPDMDTLLRPPEGRGVNQESLLSEVKNYREWARSEKLTDVELVSRLKDEIKGGNYWTDSKNIAIQDVISELERRQPALAAPPVPEKVAPPKPPVRAPIMRRDMEDDSAVTSSGRDVPVKYAVVEASDLVASQLDDGGANPQYPAELQPRDRERAVSQQQVQDIATRLDPRLLDKSPKASDGSPIIAADGTVESGNGRVLAIRRAYRQGGEAAKRYRDHLAAQGYPVSDVREPVLVRVRQGELDPESRQAFTREANERDTLGMSATERAMADATALPDNVLEMYRGGDVQAAGNREFVRAFIRDVVAKNDQANLIASDGTLSQEAIRRVEAALLGKAYGDADLVASLVESPDSNIKAIGGALMDVAPAWAQMRAEAKAGTIDRDADQTERLLEAVRLVQRARREEQPLALLVGQNDIFSGTSIHPIAEAFLRLMFRDMKNWKQPMGRDRLAGALQFYVDEERKTSSGVDLLGETAAKPADILALAKKKQDGPNDQPAQDGFDLTKRPSAGPGESAGASGVERTAQDIPAGQASRSEKADGDGSEVSTATGTKHKFDNFPAVKAYANKLGVKDSKGLRVGDFDLPDGRTLRIDEKPGEVSTEIIGKGLAEDENEVSPPSDYTPIDSFIPSDKQNLGGRAKEYVMRQGKQRGVEVVLAFDGDGNVVSDGYGTAKSVGFSRLHVKMNGDPASNIVVHHNHPSSSSFSRNDIALLAQPGSKVVWAHAADGTSYRATLNPELRDAADPSYIYNMLQFLQRGPMGVIKKALQQRVTDEKISVEQAQLLFTHFRNVALHKAGVTDYFASKPFALDTEVDKAVEQSVAAIRKVLNDENITIGRSAKRIRYIGDMGVLAEGNRQVAAAGRPDSGPDTGGGRNDRGEKGEGLANEDGPEFTAPPGPPNPNRDPEAGLFTTEPGAEGLPQTTIPGTERITESQRLQRLADAKLKPKVAQKGLEIGLFGDDSKQGSLFEDDPEFAAKVPKSKAFKKWFGKSKVVDANGDPLVVYHGTTNLNKIMESGFKKGWTHLSDSKPIADSYQEWVKGDSAGTLAVYAKAENPAYYDAEGRKYTDIGNKVFRATWDAEKAGHDSLIITNIRDNQDSSVDTEPHTTFVVFSPTQIKSIFNRGNFDPNDPAILAEDEAEFRAANFYSGLIRAVEGIKMSKAPADQWLATIKNQPGVKAEEISWLGLEEWLAEVGPSLPQKLESVRDENRSDIASRTAKFFADQSKAHPGFIERVSLVHVPSQEGVAYTRIIKTLLRDPDDLSDFYHWLSGGQKSFGQLRVNAAKAVVMGVRATTHDLKVRQAIVKLLPVDVMNDLVGEKASPKRLLDNPSVLKNALAVDGDSPIPARVNVALSSLEGEVTFPIAEYVAAALNMARVSDDFVSALGASTTDHPAQINPTQAKSKLISKEALLDFLNANQVQVSEVVKGEKTTTGDRVLGATFGTPEQAIQWLKDNGISLDPEEDWGYSNPNDYITLAEGYANSSAPEEGFSPTKFASYQLPGGENYRELLLTLPDEARRSHDEINSDFLTLKEEVATRQKRDIRNLYDERDQGRLTPDEASRLAAIDAEAAKPRAPSFYSSHFDEANILAHVRFNERTVTTPGFTVRNTRSGHVSQAFDTEAEANAFRDRMPETIRATTEVRSVKAGKTSRTLFIEEIQSDAHQKGRKQGYRKSPAQIAALKASAKKVLEEKVNPFSKFVRIQLLENGKVDPEQLTNADITNWELNDVVSVEDGLVLRAFVEAFEANPHTVPDMPFKTSWPELAMKRMIRWAAEKGFDKLAWTPGDVQNDRYDLSKQVDRIEYFKNPDGKTYDVSAYKDDSKIVSVPSAQESDLEDTVGKEIAERIVRGDGMTTDGVGILEGDNLRIGGDGMKGFYDQILVSVANKLGKKFGAKVGKTQIGNVDKMLYKGPEVIAPYVKSLIDDKAAKSALIERQLISIYHALKNGDSTAKAVEQFGSHEVAEMFQGKLVPSDHEVHSLPITDSMRDSVMQGQALFEDENGFTQPRRRQSGTRGMPASRPGPSSFIETDDSTMSVLMNQNLPMLGRIGGAISNATLPIRRGVQDKMADWKRVEKAMIEQTGVLPQSMQVYRTETLFHGRTGERLEDLRMDVIEPLIQKMADLKVTQADLDKYLYARHAPERNEYIATINPDLPDGGSGMTNAEAAAVMRDMQRRGVLANVKTIAAKIDIMLRDNRERLFNNGIIDQETFDSWSNDYEHYVPLRGFEVDPEADARLGQGKRYDSRTKVTLEALGRKSKADSPLAYIIAQAQQSIILAEKARVGRSVLRLARQYPNPNLWEVDQVVSKRVLDPTTGLVSTRIDNTARVRAENVLAVREGGKLYWVTIHHQGLLAGIKGTEASSINVVLRTGITINRYLALMRTGLDPQFFIPNFLRDLETAGIHIGAEKGRGMLKNVLRDLPKALAGSFKGERGNLTGQWAQHYREFAQAGGKVGVFGLKDISVIKNRIARDLRWAEGGTAVSALKAAIAVKDFVEDINGAIESGVRLSLYVNMRNAGYSVDDSAYAAKEVTVNFNRKGEWGNWINAIYLFFNASVQGTARIASALARSKLVRRAAFGLFLTGILMDIVNSMLAGDSDDDGENDYDQIQEHVKERNLIFMWPGSESGQETHIPLPWVYNVFAYAGGNLGRLMRGKIKPTEAAANIMGAIAQSANPLYSNSWVQMLTPTILDPGLDLYQNEDWKGDKIMPEDSPYGLVTPDSQKAWETVNPAWKWTAETLNSLSGGDTVRPGTIDVSPESIEYIWDFLLGGVGSTISQTSSTVTAIARGDELTPERIPFVRKVYGKHVSSTGRDEYYQMRDAVLLTEAQIEDAKDAKDRAKMIAVRKEFPADVRALPLLKETDKLLTKLRKQKNAATSEDAKQKINERMDLIRSRFRKKYRQLQEKLQ